MYKKVHSAKQLYSNIETRQHSESENKFTIAVLLTVKMYKQKNCASRNIYILKNDGFLSFEAKTGGTIFAAVMQGYDCRHFCYEGGV